MSIYARLAALALILAAVAAVWWERQVALSNADAAGYARRAAEDKAAADAQAARNRELQRSAERRYVVQTEARDRVITETVTEVRYVAKPLDTCPLPGDLVRVLNRAAECALDDRSSACGPGGGLPDAGQAPVGGDRARPR